MPTTVKLISHTKLPIETIYVEWIQSRSTGPVPTPEELNYKFWNSTDKAEQKECTEIFEKVLDMKLPLGETLDFIFLLEGVPIALREQLVRHRIGHKFMDRVGADIIPDLADSTFWTQTSRVTDLGNFYTEGEFFTPQWLEEHGHEKIPGYSHPISNDPALVDIEWQQGSIVNYYNETMQILQERYRTLRDAGMPLEDCRLISPLGLTHRMVWKCNLSAVMHVLSKRGCWIAQLGFWEPIITGIVNELATKIHPSFRRLIDPPCFNGKGEWIGCAFGRENEELCNHTKDLPPCSLWLSKEKGASATEAATIVGPHRQGRYVTRATKYSKLWMRNPLSGERIAVG